MAFFAGSGVITSFFTVPHILFIPMTLIISNENVELTYGICYTKVLKMTASTLRLLYIKNIRYKTYHMNLVI